MPNSTSHSSNPLGFLHHDKNRISKHIERGSSGPKDPVLVVKNLTRKFGDFYAIKDVSFSLNKGDRVAIIGANGAGKTTVAEIVAGLSKPTSGTIVYGYDFKESPQEGIGMQFQKSDYPSGLTVKDMLVFAEKLRKIKITNDRRVELLKTFQMLDFYKRKAKNLSGGQKQKLNILMSVLHEPKLVIMDELSTGLDISAREEIIRFTDELLSRGNMAAIIISHHFEEIEKLCTRVVAMDRGQIVKIDTVKNLSKEFGSVENFARSIINKSNAQISASYDTDSKSELKQKTPVVKPLIKPLLKKSSTSKEKTKPTNSKTK